MRRVVIAVGVLLGTALLGGCVDDGGEGATPAETVEPAESHMPIDVEATRQRLADVCTRTASADRHRDCLAQADVAIDQAVEAGCSMSALDAWAEHGVAWRFTSLPDEGFFDGCPVPLSNLVLRAVPEPYQPVNTRGVGLLDTPGAAASFATPGEVEDFLVQLGHQVSYSAVWVDSDGLVLVRLDRFLTPAEAEAYLDSDHYPIGGGDEGNAGDEAGTSQIPGIAQGRFQQTSGGHLATGRVCEVAMTLHSQHGADGSIDPDVALNWFRDQARRVQSAVSC